ncbi:tetratricopeptide repeat protein, partial [Streptomyces lucensis]|uniref:tetratricopeptide repeat protein n=1 Tax=Streptomyces lucensis TaxID=67319 RepID=UPI0016773986
GQQRRVLGEEHPETLRTTSNMALRLAQVGRVEEARELTEVTLGRHRRVLGEEHPDTLRTARLLDSLMSPTAADTSEDEGSSQTSSEP